MQINSVVNVEYLNLFDPSMLDREWDHQFLFTIKAFHHTHLKNWNNTWIYSVEKEYLTMGDKRVGRFISRDKLQRRKNGIRGTKLRESSLTYTWNTLRTKILPMIRRDLNWICTNTIGYHHNFYDDQHR